MVNTRYLLPCDCGQKIAVETSQAGQRIRCQCGVTHEVPTLRKIVALEPLAPESAASNAKTWGTKQRIALLGASVLVIGLGLMVVLMIQRPVMPAHPDPQNLSPLESLKVWEQLLMGPDTSRLPPQLVYRMQLAAWWRWLALDGVLVLAGFITMAIAMVVPARAK